MTAKLTPKQAQFVDEYLIDFNATQAAVRAGYSKASSNVQGSENLAKPSIQEAIAVRMADRTKRTEVTQDMVVAELAKIGFADIRNVTVWGSNPTPDESGTPVYPVELVNSSEIDDSTAAAISEVSLTAQGVKVKMYDKKGALDSLARHLGMFNDKIDHTTNGKDLQAPAPLDKALAKALAEKLTG